MLQQVGMGPRMIKRLMWCVRIVTISIIVNGSSTQSFKIHKGIRQGDPISLFLFAIIGEALFYVINEAKVMNLVKGVKVGVNDVEVSHLQFALQMTLSSLYLRIMISY